MRDCSLTAAAKQLASRARHCKAVFGGCRRAEDEAVAAVAACRPSAQFLLLAAKKLKTNLATLKDVLERTRRHAVR